MKKILSFITIILLGGMFWACEDLESGESPVYIDATWDQKDSVIGGQHYFFKMNINATKGSLDKLVMTSVDGYNGKQILETIQLNGTTKKYEYDFELPIFEDSVTEVQLRATVSNTEGDEWNGTKKLKVFAADYTLAESDLTLVEIPTPGKYNGFWFQGGKPKPFSTTDADVPEDQQQVIIHYNDLNTAASKSITSKSGNVRFARVNSFDYTNAKYNSVLNTFRSRYQLQDVRGSIGDLTAGDIILIGTVIDGKAKALGVMKVVSVPETNDKDGDIYRFLVKGMGR